MYTTFELQNLTHAARILERSGAQGYNEVVKLFGPDIAKAMTVMYLRCVNGSLQQGEANIRVPKGVKRMLGEAGLYNDQEVARKKADRLAAIKEQAAKYVEENMQDPAHVAAHAEIIQRQEAEDLQRRKVRDRLRQRRDAKRQEQEQEKLKPAPPVQVNGIGQMAEITKLLDDLKRDISDQEQVDGRT